MKFLVRTPEAVRMQPPEIEFLLAQFDWLCHLMVAVAFSDTVNAV